MMQSGFVSEPHSTDLRTSPSRHVLSVAELVRYLRLQRGWTQAVLASKIGTNDRYIRRVENGEVVLPRIKTIARLSILFGVDLWRLITHDEKDTPVQRKSWSS